MHSKIKSRPANTTSPVGAVQPLLLHAVTNPSASANAASRRHQVAIQPAVGAANHARHHVSRRTQA